MAGRGFVLTTGSKAIQERHSRTQDTIGDHDVKSLLS
jgi:hypothetical protein